MCEQIECTFKNTETGVTFVMKINSELPQSQLVQTINYWVTNELGINCDYQIIKSGILCENGIPLDLYANFKFKNLKCVGFYIRPIRNISW